VINDIYMDRVLGDCRSLAITSRLVMVRWMTTTSFSLTSFQLREIWCLYTHGTATAVTDLFVERMTMHSLAASS
jgi:hypothetical protein